MTTHNERAAGASHSPEAPAACCRSPRLLKCRPAGMTTASGRLLNPVRNIGSVPPSDGRRRHPLADLAGPAACPGLLNRLPSRQEDPTGRHRIQLLHETTTSQRRCASATAAHAARVGISCPRRRGSAAVPGPRGSHPPLVSDGPRVGSKQGLCNSASTRSLGRDGRSKPSTPSEPSGRTTGAGGSPRRPTDHMATTASRSLPAAPLDAGVGLGASATDCASLAYSFLERPDSISSEATTTSVFQ